MKSSGWAPVRWLVLARSAQLLLGIAILGIVSFFAAIYGTPVPSPFGYFVGIAAVTVSWTFISFVIYCTSGLAPLVVIVVDGAVVLAWIVAVSLDLKEGAYMLSTNCKSYVYGSYPYAYPDYSVAFGSIWCQLWKAKTGAMIVEMISFAATTALAAVAFMKHRKGDSDSIMGKEFTTALSPGKPSVDGFEDDIQAPLYCPYTPEASPVLVPRSRPHSQQLQQVPEPVYDPLGGTRYPGAPWQQQHHTDINDQPRPDPSRTRRARRPLPASSNALGTQQVRSPPPAY